MYIEFIKDHQSGIAKGTISHVDVATGTRLVKNGYAKEVSKEVYTEWIANAEQRTADAKAEVLKEAAVKSKAEAEELKELEAEVKAEIAAENKANAARLKEASDKLAKDTAEATKAAADKAKLEAKEANERRIKGIKADIRDKLSRGISVTEEKDENEDSLEKIALMENTKKELVEMCADYPKEDWEKLNKEPLADYILSKKAE